ncbi:hypothetical protein CLU79DRAFT_776822 [Phycomyces nitens]|nr:hypothetical protein CLU79DRAFT_776822 [Phycomyces nitens]
MDLSNLQSAPTSLLLQDLINAPAKAEHILDRLTSDQILMIESTINRVKRRKLKVQSHKHEQSHLPTPLPSPSLVEKPGFDTLQQLESPEDPTKAATTIANALAAAMTMATLTNISANSPAQSPPPVDTPSSSEPVAEIRDGVEWVSFVYSHNRTLKRYAIRTDIHAISLDTIDDQFKTDNCVYPRANLPKESYKGNRWAYETECNVLGWKLAWLNSADISGKRGLIQRAVDSYRNRYPSMRSRRVARQEKLMNGTLRKRKHRDEHEEETLSDLSALLSSQAAVLANNYPALASPSPSPPPSTFPLTLESAIIKPAHQPKTIAIDDFASNTRFRIKINVDSVNLEEISQSFRKANCSFPRATTTNPDQYMGGRTRWLEESMCNELGWKLAWLNSRVLAGKKNLLQRALDVYRSKFMPLLQPRRNSARTAPIAPPILLQPTLAQIFNLQPTTPLTASALSAQNAHFAKQDKPAPPASPALSCISGTTASLDFGDCFSVADESSSVTEDTFNDMTIKEEEIFACFSPISNECDSQQNHTQGPEPLLCASDQFSSSDDASCHTFNSSSANSVTCTPSPPVSSSVFGFCDSDLYNSFMLPPVNDAFFMLNITHPDPDTKFCNPLTSPSLPSSAVNQDLDMNETLQTEFLLDPLF